MTWGDASGGLRGVGLLLLVGCVAGALIDPEAERWARAALWLGAVGLAHGALAGLGEQDPERQIGHLCWIHLSWAVLGAAAHTLAPEALAVHVRGPLVCQILAHALLVPGLATWMDRRQDDERAAALGADRWAFGTVAIVAVAGVLAGLQVLEAAGQVEPEAARLGAVGVAVTVAGYARILAHGGPPGRVRRSRRRSG